MTLSLSVVLPLLVALFVILAPSALFLLLWRGLVALRDDRLADRVLDRCGSANGAPESFSVDHPLSATAGPGAEAVPDPAHERCPACGTTNGAGYRFCRDCQALLGA